MLNRRCNHKNRLVGIRVKMYFADKIGPLYGSSKIVRRTDIPLHGNVGPPVLEPVPHP